MDRLVLRYLYRVFVFILTSLLLACGGGGGSGSGDEPITGSGNQISVNAPIYSGSSEPAQLTRQNSIPYIWIGYELIETTVAMAYLVDNVPLPLFIVNDSSSDNSNDNCDDDRRIVDDKRKPNATSGEIHIQFNNCILDSSRIDGSILITIQNNPSDGYPFSVNVKGLQFTTNDDEITLAGVISYDQQNGLRTNEMVIRSEALNKYFKLTDFSYINSVLSGNLFDSTHGWVSVSQTAELNELRLKGARNSQLTAQFNDFRYGTTEDEAIFDLIFTTDAPGDGAPATLVTATSLADLRVYAYRENTPPISTLSPEMEAERLEEFVITATAVDSQYDFLSYQWKHITAPPGCTQNFADEGNGSASIQSQCQGQHELQLAINDGFNTTLQNVVINVIPLLAEVAPISPAPLGLNDSLDQTLDIVNSAEDGPFSFGIAYGPKGLTIDQTGRITGRPQPFIHSGEEHFNVAVTVDNGRTQTVTFSIDMSSLPPERSLLPSADFCYNNLASWNDVDGNGKTNIVCPLADSYKLLELNNDKLNLVYTELAPPSFSELVNLTQYDVTGDGIDEILLGYETAVFVINGQDKTVLRAVDLPAPTDSAYYTLYQPPFAFGGLLLFINGNNGPGYYLIEFVGNDNIVTKLPDEPYDPATLANIDADSNPEFLSIDGLKLLEVDGSSHDLPLPAQRLVDMDGDGDVDAVSLVSANEVNSYFERDFDLNIIDTTNFTTTLTQTLTIPTSYTEIWGPSSHIVNIDEDVEQEIILHYESIHKLFVFDYDGTDYQLIHEVDIPAELNNFQITAKNLDSNRIMVTFLDYNNAVYSYAAGGTLIPLTHTAPVFSTHLHDPYGFSKPVLTGSGDLEFFHTTAADGNNLSNTVLDQWGTLLMTTPTSIPTPYSLSGIITGAFTAPGAHEALLTYQPGERGNQVYDIDLDQLLLETTFAPPVGWPTSFLPTDIDNDGVQDILAYKSGSVPLSQIDLVGDNLLWQLTLNNTYYPVMYNPLISDFNNNNLPDVVYGLNHRTSGLELHVAEWDGQELSSRFKFSYEHLDKAYYSTTYGLQDVDGDGRQEIIIATSNFTGCNDYTLNEFTILDDDLSVLAEGSTQACIQSIPTFNSSQGKRHLIVSASSKRTLYGSTVPAYTHFEEIDIYTGNTIWKSSPFFGSLNPTSLVFFGDDNADRKAAAFTYGVYTFR